MFGKRAPPGLVKRVKGEQAAAAGAKQGEVEGARGEGEFQHGM
jgi:hypothetical protein